MYVCMYLLCCYLFPDRLSKIQSQNFWPNYQEFLYLKSKFHQIVKFQLLKHKYWFKFFRKNLFLLEKIKLTQAIKIYETNLYINYYYLRQF